MIVVGVVSSPEEMVDVECVAKIAILSDRIRYLARLSNRNKIPK